MPATESAEGGSQVLFTRRNLLFLATALATIGAGYAVLVGDSPSAAAVILVVGYCILFPLALAV